MKKIILVLLSKKYSSKIFGTIFFFWNYIFFFELYFFLEFYLFFWIFFFGEFYFSFFFVLGGLLFW